MTRRLLTVVNVHSRRGKEAAPFLEALEQAGLELVRRECPTRDSMVATIGELKGSVDGVVIAGGDGTISGAGIALYHSGLPLGILPLGTANDLARTLGIPDDPVQAAAIVAAGHTRQVDLGTVNGRPFFNVASVGVTVEITRRLSKDAKRRLGALAYPWTALKVVMSYRRFSAIIRCGSSVHRVKTLQVAVGNGRFYGGGMVVSADAAIDDNMLNVYSLEPESTWSLPFMARAFRAGEHDAIPYVRTDRSPVVEVVTRLPMPISADGEITTVTPARFGIIPRAVTVMVPAPEGTAP